MREVESKNQKGMTVKPMRMYGEQENINYNDINEGDLIIATVSQFIPPNTIHLCAGGINAKMDLMDFNYYLVGNSDEKLVKSVCHSIGKRVLARVQEKKDGQLILERSSVIKETMELISQNIGTIIDATVESIAPFGVFVDIGNGFLSLIVPPEMSKTRIYNFNQVFKIGDSIKVKIIDYDSENGLAHISRKQVYERLNENKLPRGSIIIVECKCYVNDEHDGVYVEFDPNNDGIMDIPKEYSPDEFYNGRKMAVTVKLYKEAGFKASFVRFI